MTLIDILLAVPMGWLVFRGWKHGIVREVTTLAGVGAGIWASVHLSQWVVEGMLKAAHLSLANKVAGAALGLVKALCILSVLLSNIVMLDRREILITPTVKEKSVLFNPVCTTGNWLTASLKEYIAEHRDECESAIAAEREEDRE